MENRPKPTKPKMEKIELSGAAKTKKKSGARKFADVFIAEDARNVKSYIFTDVIVPTLKNLVVDMIQETTNRLFYGSSSKPRDSRGGFLADRVSYDRFAKRTSNDRYIQDRQNSYSYDEVVLTTRSDAEQVLDRLCEAIHEYKMVSVADLYELVGIPDQFTDHKYGWTSLRNARVIRVRDGYALDLPKPFPLD